MSSRPDPSAVPDSPAEQVCRDLDLTPPARSLLSPGMTARAFAEVLVKEGHPADALGVLARWLPPHEGVRWACLCVRAVLGEEIPAGMRPGLAAAERWVDDPSEQNRRDAEKAARDGSYSTPAALAAAGAFFSGGNLAPVSSGVTVPPAPDLASKAVVGAVRMAAVIREPEKARERHSEFAGLGLSAAAGRLRRSGQ